MNFQVDQIHVSVYIDCVKTVKLKLQFDPSWRPDLRRHERYWVILPDGEYFPIFKGPGGNWYQMYSPHLDYPGPEAAIIDSLKVIYAKVDKREQWRKCRAKPQVLRYSDKNWSLLRLPARRKSRS